MRFKFIFVGRTRQAYLAEGLADYLARIKAFYPAEEIIIKETKIRPGQEPVRVKTEETSRLLAGLKPSDVFVLLDPGGRLMTSPELALWLREQMNRGTGTVAFGLGGPLGLDSPAGLRANLVLSLSKMTFTHEMSRLILLEQVYRALTINAGHPYHK